MLSELRDRLRAGDVWCRGIRQYRNFEDCLLPRPTIAALHAEGPLPVGVEEDVELAIITEQIDTITSHGPLPRKKKPHLDR